MLTLPGLFVFVCMEMFLPAQGNSDAIIRINSTLYNYYMNFSFSQDLFKEFHNCLCKKSEKCDGIYNDENIIYEVYPGGKPNTNYKYYICEEQVQYIQCSITVRPDGAVNQEINCPSSGVGMTLFWKRSNEGFIFSNQNLCEEYCVRGCYCPLATTSTTLATPSVATTSTTLATSLVITTTLTARSTSLVAINSTTLAISSPPTDTSSPSDDPDNGPQLGVIIGVVIAVMIIATVIAVVIIFLWRRKHRHNTSVPQDVTNISTDTEGVGSSRSLPQDRQNNSPYYNMVSVASSTSHLDSNSGEAVTNTSTGTHPFDNAMSFQPDKLTDKQNKVSYYNIVSVPFSGSHLGGDDDAIVMKSSGGTAGSDDSDSLPQDKLRNTQDSVTYYNVASM